MCEDRLQHEHPFIKIVRPENTPSLIITAVKEEEEEVKQEGPRRFGRGGARGGRGRAFRQVVDQMVDGVNRGLMGTKCPQQKEDKDEEWNGVFGEKRSKWSEQRAVIVSKPSEPIIA